MADDEKRMKRAFHDWLGPDGTVVDNIAKATGIRYQNAKPGSKAGEYEREGEAFDYQIPGAVPGSVITMGALFGFDTLTTNTASAARQARKVGAEGATDDITAIRNRFEELKDGSWADPSSGNRGPRFDRGILAQAVFNVLKGQKKLNNRKLEDFAAKLEADANYVRLVTSNDEIKGEYYKLKGGAAPTKASLDDI